MRKLLYPNHSLRFKLGLKSGGESGFALIATISVMALVIMIAMAMVSLSTSVVRTSQHGRAMEEAQANAHMALQMAIAKLQLHTGSDTRITAPADIISDRLGTPVPAASMPPLTGVWRSWEGTDHELTGNFIGQPKVPDYYASKELGGRFVSWLVSGVDDDNVTLAQMSTLVSKTPIADKTVPLLASGSLQVGDDREVHVPLQTLGSGGKYAWWVSPENQKARLPRPLDPENDTVADWAGHINNHSVVDPGVFGLDSLLVDPSPADKTHTIATADLYTDVNAPIRPGKSFHDLSPNSIGLLTNVATGGWRKDLSLLTERWTEQPDGNNELGLFQLLPDESLLFSRTSAANTTTTKLEIPNNMLYHWSKYALKTGGGGNEAFNNTGPISSWTNLASWATFYKTFSPTATTPSMTSRAFSSNSPSMKHDTTVTPKIARLEIILSHYAIPSNDPAHVGKLIPCVLYTPVITIWNPYNVAIRVEQTYVFAGFHNSLPLALKYKINGVSYPKAAVQKSAQPQYKYKEISNHRHRDFRLYGTSAADPYYTLQPGETKVFSPQLNTKNDDSTKDRTSCNMRPHYRNGLGFYFRLTQKMLDPVLYPSLTFDNLANSSTIMRNVVFDPSVKIQIEELSIDNGSIGNCGVYGQFGFGGGHEFIDIQYPQADANTLYPPLTELIGELTLEQCKIPQPFASFKLGTRSASPELQASKGLVQSSPTKTRVIPGLATGQRHNVINYNYPGGKNLINCAWDYSIEAFTSGPGGTLLPDVDATGSGYIITGSRKADGISSCVLSDVPIRPISSLGELTHWDARGLNGFPPFTHNVIGNSDATPLVAADQVYVPVDRSRDLNSTVKYWARKNMQNDDSYNLNHLFFDDWFVSSIAPQPAGFGSGGGTFEDTYKKFVQGDTQLANRAYRPVSEDNAANAAVAEIHYTDNVLPVDSWKTIASRLEVEGMFNVNSTSVKAWRALLGHARNQKIPYLNASGNGVDFSDPTDYAFPRAGVAGAQKAGTAIAGKYIGTTEFTGYRVLDGPMLDMLAEEVVKQVRLRGPFLSLSEFVNRKLTTDSTEEELALGGAIQAALNALTADTILNPFEDLQNESNPSVANPIGDPEYAFPEAAVGHSSYGLPGWTRQVDVLRPLAPVLSARDDTFTIRAYGESLAADGTVKARAWCEATVRRTKDFVDTSNSPTSVRELPLSDINIAFGRRFKVLSFKWLNASEV